MYYKGFDKGEFMSWLAENFTVNNFSLDLIDNIVEYAHQYEHVAKDQFCYFVADLIPEVGMLDVARFCEDGILTKDTLKALRR